MDWCETCMNKFGIMPRWLAVAIYHFGDTTGYLSFCDDTCPGFGWDRVNFFLSTWYSAVFWIQGENNVGNTLMFQLLLSSAYLKPRTFQFPMLCQQAGVQEAGREQSRGS